MAITECKIYKTEGHWRVPRNDRYTVTYRILSDTREVEPIRIYGEAITASPDPLPERYDTYNYYGSFDDSALALDYDFSPRDDKMSQWDVRVTFRRPESPDENPDNDQIDPLDRSTKWSVEWEDWTSPIIKAELRTALSAIPRNVGDIGAPVNAVNEQFDTPLIRNHKRMILIGKKNLGSFEAVQDLDAMMLKVNSTDYTIEGTTYAPRTLKLYSVAASDPIFDANTAGGAQQFYWQTTVRIATGAEWDHEVVNAGYRYLDPAYNPATDPIGDKWITEDSNGIPYTKPELLTLGGALTAEGELGTTIFYREIDDEADFSSLPL